MSNSGDVWGQVMCSVTYIEWFTALNSEQELCAPSRKEARAREMFTGTDRQMPVGVCLQACFLPICFRVRESLCNISPISLI